MQQMLELIQESLNYNEHTGVFTWKYRPRYHFNTEAIWKQWNSRWSGKIAGTIDHSRSTSYVRIALNDKLYYAHQIAFLLLTGEWVAVVDHKDGNGLNNKPNNLLKSSTSLNGKNRKMTIKNKTGITGVHWSKQYGYYVAQGKENNKTISLHTGSLLDCAAVRKSWEVRNGFSLRHGTKEDVYE